MTNIIPTNEVNFFRTTKLNLTPVFINGIPIDSLIDTGANCSLIKESIAKRLGCHFSPISMYLTGIGLNKIHAFAMITVVIQCEGVSIELDVHVVRDYDFHYNLLIGRNAVNYPDIEIITNSLGSRFSRKTLEVKVEVNVCTTSTELRELTSKIEHLDSALQEKIINIFTKYPSVLDETSNVKTGELKLSLVKNEIINYRPYRLAPIEREKVNKIIQDLLKQNIIRESDSSFANPVILVKKKDGSDRLCVDYRSLNKIVEKNRYPLPLIEDQMDRLGKARFFISIDMKNGFYQIPVSSDYKIHGFCYTGWPLRVSENAIWYL